MPRFSIRWRVVLAVEHFDGHSLEVGHCQPVLSLFIKACLLSDGCHGLPQGMLVECRKCWGLGGLGNHMDASVIW